jgi:hypothetical protein
MITKEQFDKLYSDDITKKQYDKITDKIDSTITTILKKMHGKKSGWWWRYSNGDYNDAESGQFDLNEYKEYIALSGDIHLPEPFDDYIPTHWLWTENWELEFQTEVQKHQKEEADKKAKAKKQREARKQRLAELRKSIESKLTKEELKAITFKK